MARSLCGRQKRLAGVRLSEGGRAQRGVGDEPPLLENTQVTSERQIRWLCGMCAYKGQQLSFHIQVGLCHRPQIQCPGLVRPGKCPTLVTEGVPWPWVLFSRRRFHSENNSNNLNNSIYEYLLCNRHCDSGLPIDAPWFLTTILQSRYYYSYFAHKKTDSILQNPW